jgi:hypothetical protein
MNTSDTAIQTVNSVEVYLRFVSDMYPLLSPMRLVLQHGERFAPERVLPVGMGKVRECFCNAARLVLNNGDKYIYCEGYAAGILPVPHAWAITADTREVVEPTWREIGVDYYGIPFNSTYLRSRLVRYGYYGLIDRYEFGFPILQESPEEWLHESYQI